MAQTDSVAVNGEDLRFHRKKQFSSAEAFAAACGSVSVPTIYRAERGGPVLRSYLNRMAAELGVPLEYLVASKTGEDESASNVSLTGAWRGLFTATDRTGKPYIVIEDAELEHNGSVVEGSAALTTPYAHLRDRWLGCKFKRNILFGHIVAAESRFPLEATSFILSGMRNTSWLHGHRIWFDLDTKQAEASKYFLIRKNAQDFEDHVEHAEGALHSEIKLLRTRRLLEAGYEFEIAVEMLGAVSRAE